MTVCIVYFSRTGNTKRLAQALSDITQAKTFEISTTNPDVIKNYDVVMVGTPVEGFKPAKEIMSFLEAIASVNGKKAILFCTYTLWRGFTFQTLSKLLKRKGYDCILKVSKRKVTTQTDFSDTTSIVEKILDRNEFVNWLITTNESKRELSKKAYSVLPSDNC
jgi:flavodoxin